jgi:hypothetical protein
LSAVFSKQGFGHLRVAWLALGVATAVAIALALGSYWYLQNGKQESLASARRLQGARTLTDAVKREFEDLRVSSRLYEDLVNRGILQEESRLDLVERLDALRTRHKLLGLEYEIEPQRPLPLAGGRVFNAVDVMGSQVKLRAQALHEGDALAFLEDLAVPPRGFNPLDRCHLRRIERVGVELNSARVEADCTLEWISLKDKGTARAK